MPDLKFDGNFYFSANTPSKGHPLLVPIITNPEFTTSKGNATPGILELINGDIGITEKIMNPILSPIINQIAGNPLMVDSIANLNNLEKNNPDALKSFLTQQFIPKDIGLKPLEKTIISSMMESHKPLIEFLKLFLQALGVAEDIVCRFLGSHISILGVDIGIKSRNPFYWNEELGYTKTITLALKDMLDATEKAAALMDSKISDKNPIKNSSTGIPKDKASGETDLPAYYVAYFDEDGKSVEPPLWVKNSNKWFSKTIQDRNGELVTIGAPFQQLSDNLNEGVSQLRTRQTNQLASMRQERDDMIKTITERLKEAEKISNPELKKNEIDSINAEKTQVENTMNDLIQAVEDIIDGTNKAGGNYIDDNDKSKGINPPAIINEWAAKSRGSQFRGKYYPEQKSTVQSLINNKGKVIEPYIFIPKFGVNYQGNFYNIEVPLAFDNQITKNKSYSNTVFFDAKQTEFEDLRIRNFSNVNVVTSLNLNPQNIQKPFEEINKTHFSNNIREEYVPDNIKRFYLPIEWEEVLEYEIRSKNTGKILKIEREYVPFKIDVENDYELRLIKVINIPLLSTGANNPVDNFFPDPNSELILYVKDDYIQFLKTNKEVNQYDIKIDYPSSGTNGNIPSNKFSHGTRYVDENAFIDEKYFYLRKDTTWGRDYIDADDSEIYQVKNINKKWKNVSSDIDVSIDNVLKTITFNSIISIPTYITEYTYGNNFIINTNSQNINISIKITNITNINNQIVLNYEGSLISETITNNLSFQYIESSFVETYQFFTEAENFTASIFTILDINYLPDVIKNGGKSLIIQGFDENSLLSTLSNRVKKEGNDITQFVKPNAEADNIYNIIKIEKISTRKGVEITSLKLDFPIPEQFNNKAYSSNTTLGFYYPLRIYTVPQINNQGAGNSSSSGLTTGTGTLYTTNNNIPDKLNIEDPESTIHSTKDINENNFLKEGIIFHGLDPRFVDRNKWKIFYLVEAIKKDNSGNADVGKTKKKVAEGVIDGGKEWYGLVDKFTALPMIISKLVPLIFKIVPLAIKIIQLISNPKKMKDLLLDMGIMDEDISKFPQNFKTLSKSGFLRKEKELAKKKPAKNFDEYEKNKSVNVDDKASDKTKSKGTKDSSLYYDGPQIGKTNPSPIFMLDGQALAEFGKGAFGKTLFSFGAELKNGEIKSISKLKKNKSTNESPETRDQGLFNMVLNFIKLPFEIIFKIFKWIIDWIKKLLNPAKIASAITEFLSFKWLLEILGKNSIFQIMGLKDISSIQKETDELVKNISGEKAQEMFNNILKNIRGNNLGFVEVYVYDILKNGIKIRQDVVESPYSGNDINKQKVETPNGSDASLNDINNILNDAANPLGFCGDRNFSISKLFPLPFFNTDIAYNNCELPILFLKPLELIAGMMTFIQEFLNGFLSMPTSILGLEPTISVPKFGEEIPFANVLNDLIEDLKAAITQIQIA